MLSLRRVLIERGLEVLFGNDVILHDFFHLHHTFTQTIQVIAGLLKDKECLLDLSVNRGELVVRVRRETIEVFPLALALKGQLKLGRDPVLHLIHNQVQVVHHTTSVS